MPIDPSKRNALILAACQALYMTGTSLMIATSPLVGYMLAEQKNLATLPLAAHHAGIMLATMPASLLMARIGRRPAFMAGACLGILGATLAGYAIVLGDFFLFCGAVMVVGLFNGFAVFYRFAAADTASPEFRPKAISWVMTGGLVAAFLGPEIAKHTKDLLLPFTYAAAYFSLIGVYVLSIALLTQVRIPLPRAGAARGESRPLLTILRQPACAFAIVAAIVAYAVMSLLMTSAPLAMQACGFEFAQSATAIQLHIFGMFAPSFFTGQLISRFGVMRVITAGIVVNMVCAAIHLAGIEFAHFSVGMLLLGIGWNFMFIGATTLLTETHRPAERGKVQGFNDFVVFATVAVAAFSSGNLLHFFGWDVLNYGVLPVLAIILAFSLAVRPQARAEA